METASEQPVGSSRCPICGSPLDSRATICAACGTPLAAPVSISPEPMPAPEQPPDQPAGASAVVDEPAQHVPPVPPVTPVESATPATPTAPSAQAKRCDWCGAWNAPDAERCAQCQARFPRPEQDEAMRRAGEARIQAAEDEIALRQRARKWYSLGRRSSDR